MKNTFGFPSPDFKLVNGQLHFHNVPMLEIVRQYGTPLKLTFLPKISANINHISTLFKNSMDHYNYRGKYFYCYCTKSSHFEFVIKEVLKNDSHLETSSAFDISIVEELFKRGYISNDLFIICNGYKRPQYLSNIIRLINGGFKNCVPILDNLNELQVYESGIDKNFDIGMRLASDEEPNFNFYTSRLGIRYSDLIPYYLDKVKNSHAKPKILHYFINTGIKDSSYYWGELNKFLLKYCELRKYCPSLDSIDIGGGFPIKNSLKFSYNYEYMIDRIISTIQHICQVQSTPTPHIFTEFGSYTVGESGAAIYSVLGQKRQNEKELWYMMDGSFITQLPDIWGLKEKFIMLPINNWDNTHHKVNIGGLTCDSKDYYDSEAHTTEVFLPKIVNGNKLYFGFFNTGAYQDALGGYGGIQHCLIPASKHVVIDRDINGNIKSWLFNDEQTDQSMLRILGY